MYLGVNTDNGCVFEGRWMRGASLIWPAPVLTPANFGYTSDKLIRPADYEIVNISKYLFREDGFDPVTRIRRGRFYKQGPTQPERWTTVAATSGGAVPIHQEFSATTFISCSISDDIVEQEGEQKVVVLGTRDAFSVWVVVGREFVHSGEVLFTLKARQNLGALPEIDWNKINDEDGLMRDKIENLSNEIYRAGPESVVDRAREAATAILTVYLAMKGVENCRGKELGDLIKKIANDSGQNNQRIVVCAAEIPQRLHSRTKYSERVRREVRLVREQDAELAVHCIGAILCDLGWAHWR